MSEAKKPVPPVRIFRGPQPDVALPDIPLGRQLREVPRVDVPVTGVVDLTGRPRIILVIGPGGSGKAQPNDALVLTPTGFRPMGSLEIGDPVLCPDGRVASIVGVFPQGEKEIFRVTFQDGRTVECCDDHLWKVGADTYKKSETGKNHETRRRLPEEVWRVRSIAQIRQILAHGKVEAKEIGIPLVSPYALQLPPQDLPIAPYALGALVGDGHFTSMMHFSTAEPEMLDLLMAGLPDYVAIPTGSGKGYDYRLKMRDHAPHVRGDRETLSVHVVSDILSQSLEVSRNGRKKRLLTYNGETKSIAEWASCTGVKEWTILGRILDCRWPVEVALGFAPIPPRPKARYSPLMLALNALGYKDNIRSYEQFIPEIYKRGSIEQRIALMQGLMDTEGSVAGWKGTHATFSSTSERLALDVQEIAWSLGARAKIAARQTYCSNGKNGRVAGRPSWRVSIVHPDISAMFSLPRKVVACRPTSFQQRLRIMSVEAIGKKDARCISIDHPDQLYVTNNYIVTHNSTLCRMIGETSLDRSIDIIAAIGERRDLLHYFRGAVQPNGFDPSQEAQWLEALITHCMDEQMSALVDLDGGDGSLASLLQQQDDLVATVEAAGVAVVALYLLTPRVSDLSTLAMLEQAGFQPKATALILNRGDDDAFGPLQRHAAFKAAVARGAVVIRMPKLHAAAAVEARMIGFEHARDGTFPSDRTGSPLNAFDRGRVARWIALMADAFGPLTKAGWW
jgi:hypothetical protein